MKIGTAIATAGFALSAAITIATGHWVWGGILFTVALFI